MFPDRSDFDYDYETLRTTGLTLAIVMFVGGILIALTRLASRQRQKCLLRLCEGPVSVMAPAPGENVSLWFLCSSSRCTSASDTLGPQIKA
uniref:FXYD domain-containing ion transport regulator n=1 Tax=Knipowitschia caucasica TaxID=637954 RepID=A0AAV2MDC5_KNICA